MKYEIKKLSTSKFFILLLICLLANLFFCYTGISELPAGKEEMDRYLALYINDYESFEAAYRSLGPIDDGIDPSRLPSDAYCMKTIAEQAMYLSRYREELSATLFQAEVNLSRLDPHTFMYRYQSQILEIYPRLAEQPMEVSQIRGWDFFFEYHTSDILSAIFIILAAVLLFMMEEECAMTPIHQTCIRGRFRLSVNKSLVMLFLSALIIVLQTVLTLLCLQIKTGLTGQQLPIQMLPPFEFAPYSLSIGGFALFQFLFKIAGVFLLGLVTAAVTKFTRTPIFSFAFSVLLLVIESRILPDDTLQNAFGRYLNLYQLLCADDIFRRYAALNLFGYAVDAVAALIFCFLFCCGALYFALYRMCQKVPSQRPRILSRIRGLGRRRRGPVLPASYPFCEIQKLRAKKWMLLLAALLIVFKCYSVYGSVSDIDDTVYRDFLAQLEGEYSAEKDADIQDIRFEIDEILQRKEQIAAAYREGEIDERTYESFMEQYWDSYVIDREFEKVEAQNEYLKQLQAEGKTGWFLYDTGFSILFGGSADWLFCLFLFLLTHWLFLDENSLKITSILKTTRNGRTSFFLQKIGFALVLGALSAVLFSAVDWIMMTACLPSSALQAPAYSLPLLEGIQSEITILQMYIVCFLLRLATASLSAAFFACLGLYFERFVSLATGALAFLFVPALLGKNITFFAYIDITAFLSGSRAVVLSSQVPFLSGWGILWVQILLYGALSLLFFYRARKKWCQPS